MTSVDKAARDAVRAPGNENKAGLAPQGDHGGPEPPRPRLRTRKAYEQQFVDPGRLRQAAALLRTLAAHKAAIRALLTSDARL